jgi:hypothetical protein
MPSSIFFEQKGIAMVGLIHGFAASDWIRARDTARAILIKQARRPNPFIAYSDLVAQLPIALEAHDPRLSALLDEISTSEYDQGRGFLTALVVHKNGSVIPGPGFFEMARKNGREFDDSDRFFFDAYTEVTNYWKANRQET